MKTKILSLVIVSLIGTVAVFAANKSEKIDVKGNCGMCKTRIENVAKGVDGVSKAEWNQETKQLSLAFDDAKTNLQKIETAIAKVGHDTPLVKASDESYNALPSCCKYERSDAKQK